MCPFYVPFACLTHAEGRKRKLASTRRHLEHTSAALGSEMWQRGADHLDGADEVRIDLVADLVIAYLLRGAEEPAASIVDDHMDLSEMRKCSVYYSADIGRICQAEVREPKLSVVPSLEIVHLLQFASRTGNPVAALQKMLCHDAAEATINSRNELCTLWQGVGLSMSLA